MQEKKKHYFSVSYFLYTDTIYNSKLLHKDSFVCTNVSVYIEFDFIATEIQIVVVK